MSEKETIICVVGDSYAGHRPNAKYSSLLVPWSWVFKLEGECHKLTGESFPGQSYWHQRRWFFANQHNHRYERETVLIFCHTTSSRLPHEKDFPVTGQVLRADVKDPRSNELFFLDPTGELFNLAKSFYSSDLFVEHFYANAMYAWLAELPKLTQNYKKVIHFFGFEDGLNSLPDYRSQFCVNDLVTDNSVVVLNPLKTLTHAERGNTTWGGPDIGPDRANHFNQHNNHCMFEEIKHIIKNVPSGSVREIDTTNWDLVDRSLIGKIKLHRNAQ